MSVKVLMYHQVVSDETQAEKYRWTTTISQLEEQLGLLKKWGYKIMSLRDYSESCTAHHDGKFVIMTFDDGYEEMFACALPVLKQFDATATFFIVGDRSIKTNTWDEPKGLGNMGLMSEKNIREIHANGFEVGAHSMTHMDLTRIPGDVAEKEIRESKACLEELLQMEVMSFAYPLGSTNPVLERIVKESGYKYGCGVYSGPPKFGMDRFNIRRIPITRATNGLEFAMKILTPYEYYAWLRWQASSKVLGPFRHK